MHCQANYIYIYLAGTYPKQLTNEFELNVDLVGIELD